MKSISSFHYLTQDLDDVSHEELCREACLGGVKWVQFRTKKLSQEQRMEQALKCRKITRDHNAKLIINDYVNLVVEVEADGVHLGKEDMSVKEARNYLGEQLIIGGTANNVSEIKDLLNTSVDYIGYGPFNYTKTKDKIAELIGLEGYISMISSDVLSDSNIPIIAIGGIKVSDIEVLINSGVNGVAVSSAINLAQDRVQMTKEMLTKMELWKN